MRAGLALVLGVLAAAAVGCGSKGTIPRTSSSQIKAHLASVRANLDSDNCGKLQSRIAKVESDITNLAEQGVPERLRRNLKDGLDQLSQRAGEQCEQSATQDVPTIPAPTNTQTTPTASTPTQTTAPDTQTAETTTGPVLTDTGTPDTTGGGGTPAPGPGGAAPTGPGAP